MSLANQCTAPTVACGGFFFCFLCDLPRFLGHIWPESHGNAFIGQTLACFRGRLTSVVGFEPKILVVECRGRLCGQLRMACAMPHSPPFTNSEKPKKEIVSASRRQALLPLTIPAEWSFFLTLTHLYGVLMLLHGMSPPLRACWSVVMVVCSCLHQINHAAGCTQ